MPVNFTKYTFRFSARTPNGQVILRKRTDMSLPQVRRTLARRKVDPDAHIRKLLACGMTHSMTARMDGTRSMWHIEPSV